MTIEINFATVAVQEATLVHRPVFELLSSSFWQLVLLCSVTVVVLCYLLRGCHSSVPHPYIVSANVPSVCQGSLLISPDFVTFHWAPMTRAFHSHCSDTVKNTLSQMLCQFVIIGTYFDFLISVFFKFLLN